MEGEEEKKVKERKNVGWTNGLWGREKERERIERLCVSSRSYCLDSSVRALMAAIPYLRMLISNEYHSSRRFTGIEFSCFNYDGNNTSFSESFNEPPFGRIAFHQFCARDQGSRMEYECSSIDYFPNEEYSPDPSDSTMAIPFTKSAMFFFAATSLLVVAEVCYFTAHVTHPRHRLCVFVAGVVFIVSGLLMLVGMVMYISVFKAEVGSKLRPRSSFQGPPFTYRYGFSFLLYVSGFITTEVAGTYAIFLYISWHQKELGVYHLDNHHVHHANHATMGHSGFLCERHQKRYFFGRDSVDHVDFDEFLPPPPNLDYHDYSRQFPRDLTTQTVSTTADVLQEEEEEYSPSVQHEFVTFDLDEPLPPPPPVRAGEWTFDTLRKTTPNFYEEERRRCFPKDCNI
ncbi:Voltage-dependent calcium channel gamma-7 subunit [Melipona quadrifasciata]|uniref:Voltage-dependent calcium channel gamma-7 subunit n=1 Tax=Melipona quadrifasciata TaxID=166423 RepID=A0A0M8ZUR7_9HYME|nr:Voltage-dependent calcium channel gamma-7 subunit [Melipona quadrifasciata]